MNKKDCDHKYQFLYTGYNLSDQEDEPVEQQIFICQKCNKRKRVKINEV